MSLTKITEKNKTTNGNKSWELRCSGCKPRGGAVVESNSMSHLNEEAARHESGDHRSEMEAFPERYFGTPEHIEHAARSGSAPVGYQLNWLGMTYRAVLVVGGGERVPNWSILPQAGELHCIPQEDVVFNRSEIPDHFQGKGPNDHWAS